jgi:plastocyanin
MVLSRAPRVALVSAVGVTLLVGPMPVWLSAQSRGVTIRGRVELPRLPAVTERRPSAGDLGEGPARDVVDRRRAVVYFESAPKGAFEDRDGGRAAMDQRNETFVPHLLAVTVGTTVDFPNSDKTYHNVFSLSKARRFDLGRYAAGRSKAVRFDRPGIVRVFCDIHAHMNAFILVFNHRYFSVADTEGRYEIDRVPPGTYTLVAWVEGSIRETRSVQVTAESRGVEANFALR